MDSKQFAQALKLSGLKQSEFARIVGYSPRQVAKFVAGEAEVPQAVEIVLNMFSYFETLRKSGKKGNQALNHNSTKQEG